MLEKGIGYPLYEPQPDCEPSSEYWGKGVRVGDVGIVTADGIFDFLFNVCPSQNPSINPPTIPEDFIEELDCQVRVVEHLQPNACLFSSGVNRSQDPGGSYTCLGPNGAILELPVGATRFEAKDKLPLKRLAARDAEKWYRYTILNMGRDAQNGSLYLVTTCIKCTDWGIAVFERPSAPDCLRFIIDEGLAEQNHPKYSWEGLGAFITRVTPNPNNLGSNDGNILNQCVFLRGYKIELRKDIWDNLESSQSTTKSYTTTSHFANKGNKSTRKGNSGNQNDCSRSETGFGPRLTFGTTNLAQDVIEHGAIAFPAESERVTVHADFSSSPVRSVICCMPGILTFDVRYIPRISSTLHC
ncbi:hypothetical protein M378DRAFT_87818 [Amanita muscaria Koide BX008]|uniref:Uncharacterized protein n=1 Tax=Amanita muscaria (strain Koide BX008) TaxID=946122 RepID=A0A0C2W8N2_AMAMK|nr:hypothetical protein M378DRAFT_87818 [Amanita muscaria Koide BX008]